jgi:hypothetical protein
MNRDDYDYGDGYGGDEGGMQDGENEDMVTARRTGAAAAGASRAS